MKRMSETNYKEILLVIHSLAHKFNNLSEVVVEELIWGIVPKCLDKYSKDRGKFYSFVYNVGYNKIRDQIRRDSVFRKRVDKHLLLDDEFIMEFSPSSEYLILKDDFYEELENVVDDLSIEQRNVLYLYIMGHSTSSMMSILEETRKSVKYTLQVVLNILKDRLQDYGEFIK